MNDLPVHVVSGLPRSGTTLLVNLLGQNPAHHVTPTSGLIHLLLTIQRRWMRLQEFQAQGLENAKPLVIDSMRGLVAGYFRDPLSEGKTIFDKSRGWVQHAELLEELLERPIHVITVIRDVRAIVASWERLYRNRGIEWKPFRAKDELRVLTSEDRARRIVEKRLVTGRSIERVRDALWRRPERLIVVPYRQLTHNPVDTMRLIHQALDLPEYAYDPGHVAQITHENDVYLGADLHTIRPKIEPEPAEPWKGILTDATTAWLGKEFADINKLAAGPVLTGGKPAQR